MPLSPEIRTIPETIVKFTKAGVTFELIGALSRGETGRDLAEDAKRILPEFKKSYEIITTGIENIPLNSGALMVFNHPNMDVLLPAMLELMVKSKEIGGANPVILQGSEIPLFGKLNESSPLPGSIGLLRKFHGLYPNNIISVPMSKGRPDFESGRFMALRKAITSLKDGNFVFVSPEGHVEIDNEVSPLGTFHKGSGAMGIIASRIGIPVLPIGIWSEKGSKRIDLSIGKPFSIQTNNEFDAAIEEMSQIALVLPKELRGPFKPF